MPDLQHDLAALESLHGQAEAQLATQQADQQAQLQALTDQWTQENTTLAREVIMLSGAIRHVRAQIARDEQAQQAEALRSAQEQQETAIEALSQDMEQADTDRSYQAQSLSLMQRIHSRQQLDADRFAAAIPDNDPD